jgi:hypothetical protein
LSVATWVKVTYLAVSGATSTASAVPSATVTLAAVAELALKVQVTSTELKVALVPDVNKSVAAVGAVPAVAAARTPSLA